MDKLFELSAVLTLDAAAFLQALEKADAAARTAAATLSALARSTTGTWNAAAAAIRTATENLQTFLNLQGGSTPAPGFATGLDYVPYDDFPARLHQGEAVLTALEAAQWRSGQQAAPAPDPSALAQAVAGALSGAAVLMDGQAVGRLVTPTVSREIARQTALNHIL